MADYGIHVLPPAYPVASASGLTISTLTVSSFGSAVLFGVSGLEQQKGAAEKAPGDYPIVYAIKEVSTARETLYTVPAGTTAYVRYALFANNSAAARVVQVWAGGRRVEPGLALAVGQSKSDSFLWILKTGQTLEVVADGAGVDCIITGIEEVR